MEYRRSEPRVLVLAVALTAAHIGLALITDTPSKLYFLAQEFRASPVIVTLVHIALTYLLLALIVKRSLSFESEAVTTTNIFGKKEKIAFGAIKQIRGNEKSWFATVRVEAKGIGYGLSKWFIKFGGLLVAPPIRHQLINDARQFAEKHEVEFNG